MYNVGPEATHSKEDRPCHVCGHTTYDWNGYDGEYECRACGEYEMGDPE